MAHWIGAVVCAVVAAYTTQGKGKNLPLASVLAGAAIVLSFKPFSGSRRSTDDHNDASKDTEMEMNVNGTTLKEIHVKVNQNPNVAEATEVLRVPTEDEVTGVTLNSVMHLEVHSKKHGKDENENGNSCMVSVLDSTSHLNSSRSDVDVKFEKVDHVVITPHSSVENKEDEHQSLGVEHIVSAPQESVSESGSVLEESSPHESSGSSVTKVLTADGSRKEDHRFVEPSQKFDVSESGNMFAEQKEEFVESLEEGDVPEFCNLKVEHVDHTSGTTTLHESILESRDFVEVTDSVGNKELESVDKVDDFSKVDTESSQEPDDVLDVAKATAVKRLENAVENHHIDDAESQQSVGSNECAQPKGHSRTLSDTASSSSMAIDTKDNTSTLHSLDQKASSGSESCASSFSLPSSRVYPESRSESEPRSPKSYVTVGSYYYEGGEDHTAESSPMIMSTKSKSASGTTLGAGDNLSASARAAQEERLQAYDAYLEDPTLSPSIKKQVLRARKIALQRLALG